MSHRTLPTSLLACGRLVRSVIGSDGRRRGCGPSTGEQPLPRPRPWSAALSRSSWSWRHSGVARRRATSFGSRLQSTRERATLTQDEIAGRAGIGLDFYRRLECGDPAALSVMTVDLLWLIADALGITPRQLFEGLD